MHPYLVPAGWGFLIAIAFMLAGLWKPLEYVVAPIPAIALFVVLRGGGQSERIDSRLSEIWVE